MNSVDNPYNQESSFILLATQPSKLVSYYDIKLGHSLNYFFPFPCGYIMCNLSTVSPVNKLMVMSRSEARME